MKTLNPAVARVLKRLHYPLDVILTCVRWYVANPLSLRLEEMMAERGVSVDPFCRRRPKTQCVFWITDLGGKALQHCSARHAFPGLESLGA